MLKICTVVGARPQFVKAAAVSAEFASRPEMLERVIHTGQHYDAEMSEIFFQELKIPREAHNLAVGSGPHGEQTGKMLAGLEKVFQEEKPDTVMLYGDTNSTLAGALAASKLHIPCAHVEAGMRSFNRKMPEEINRVVADHLSDINFCSCPAAVENLTREGRGATARLVGDVMCDCVRLFAEAAVRRRNPLSEFGLSPKGYVLFTCHRAENTDAPERLAAILGAMEDISRHFPAVWPMHPRTSEKIKSLGMKLPSSVKALRPVGYFDSLVLQKNAACLVTDSGGMQKEAFFLGTPCVTARDETEWVETVDCGWNVIAGADRRLLSDSALRLASSPPPPAPNPYGDGHASAKIADILLIERSSR